MDELKNEVTTQDVAPEVSVPTEPQTQTGDALTQGVMHERDMKKETKKQDVMKILGKIGIYLFLSVMAFIVVFPFLWMIATSFKSAEEVQLVIPTLFPHEFHPENYLNVLQKANFMKYYWNTIVMTAGILFLQVSTGILAAYGFAVGRFKGRAALFYVVLGALMIPHQVTFIPIYIMCANWNLCDTFLGLILPEAVSAY